MLILIKGTMTEISSILRQGNLKVYLIFTTTVYTNSLFKMKAKHFENGSFSK